MRPKCTLSVLLLCSLVSTVRAEGDGQVKLPLDVYTRLMQQAQNPPATPRPAPAGYALGQARIDVRVKEDENQRAVAEVEVKVPVEVLEDEWTAVVVLPAGTAVDTVTVDGESVQLLTMPQGLVWATNKHGTQMMNLHYRVDAQRSETGTSLTLPLPQAASATLSALLPSVDLAVSLVPAAGIRTSDEAEGVRVTATIPTTSAVQIAWRDALATTHVISRATYAGTLTKDAVSWTAQFGVELGTTQAITLALLPTTITLSDVRVDGKGAPILVVDDHFATKLQGKGPHTIVATFQVPISSGSGPPKVSFAIPEIPVSRFDLTMSGHKELKTSPSANVVYAHDKNQTVATVYLPMASMVELAWTEAVPEAEISDKRIDATLFHAVHAEEGVVYVRTTATYDVTRGETNVLELEVPADVQLSRVESPSGAISDWRIADADGQRPRRVSVFLDRQWKGPVELEVDYDRSLPADGKFTVPLANAVNVHRQHGSLVLLSTKEWTLNPVEELKLTRIGENQIPAAIRDGLKLKVAHTFKYIDKDPQLVVAAAAPERQQGKFDAQVDTLISLADVTLKGSVSIDVNVKSGTMSDLQLELPAKVNLLSLTAPSKRTHTVTAGEGDQPQVVDVQFTQDMDGQFRLELGYELILADGDAPAGVPVVKLRGAEVEQGHVAVEALSAVEVQPASVEHLTLVDPTDLPQQLILKTTNPILLAYKYVQVEPAPQLALKMTRHQAIEVQAATIDSAVYRTLFTADGLAVTAAEFTVRNSREQFLRLQLPAGSQVWSAFVNGAAEKPAVAERGGILIKIINSAQGFPVNLIYATPTAAIGTFGSIAAQLPRPEMIVTQTRWEVYLPDEFTYGRISTTMNIAEEAQAMSRDAMQAELGRMSKAAGQVTAPLHIEVPVSGIRFAFDKLYANQSERPASFSIAYTSHRSAIIVGAANAAGA